MRYFVKEQSYDFIREYGTRLWGRHPGFREEIIKYIGNYRSHIKEALATRFMVLPDASTESLKAAFAKSESQLHLGGNVDVFDRFSELDVIAHGTDYDID
jgi:hypothetical protein